MLENYNEIFTKIRLREDLTQEQIAERLSISRSTVAKIESNRQGVTKKILEKLIEVFPKSFSIFQSNNGSEKEHEGAKKEQKDIEVRSSMINLYDLTIVKISNELNSHLKTLNFIASLLNSNKYSFSDSEIRDIKYYNDVYKTILSHRLHNQILNPEALQNLNSLIKSDLPSLINELIFKTSNFLKFEIKEDLFE